MLKDNYPEYVKAVKNGKTNFKLDNPTLIRRFPLDDNPYPTPYLIPVLQSLAHKRNLQKMDYSIAARVIGAIMLIKMGDSEFPLTEDDDDLVDDLKSQMLWRNRANNVERVFQLFTNHTVTMEWVMPDVKALLDDRKYDAVNSDILFGLGFPRILLTGETAKTGTSQSEFALLSPAETMKSTRELMLDWPRRVYADMRDRNDFENTPEPKFEEIRLYDLSKLFSIADMIYERGGLSKETLARIGGFNFEDEELPQRVREGQLFNELDIPEYPLMPFTNQAGGDNAPSGADNDDETNQDS
jgi:hypothetical protein